MDISKIRFIIREEVCVFFENFKSSDAQKNKEYTPNELMKKNATNALIAIEKNNLTNSGGNEGSGVKKAKNISNGEKMSHSMLKRMKAFFDNNLGEYTSAKSTGKTIHNSGIIQSWNLWGGDAARTFVNHHIDSLSDSNLKRKKIRRDVSVGNGTGNVKRLIDTNYHRKK